MELQHKPSAFLPESLLTWGRVRVLGDTVAVAGERCTLEVEATLSQPLEAGHSVEVWTHFVSDLERPQRAEPAAYYYVRLEQIDGAVAWSSPIWFR